MIRINIAHMLYDALNKCQKLEVNEKKKTRYFELFILVLIDAKLSPCHRRGPFCIVYKC